MSTRTEAWVAAILRERRRMVERERYQRDRDSAMRQAIRAGLGVCSGPRGCQGALAKSNTSGLCRRCVTAERQRAHWQRRALTFARTRDAARSA